jgi:release factor glutamine methyltransferase
VNSLRETLAQGQAQLAGSESARLDAELLLAHVLGLSRAQLFTRAADPVGDDDARRYAGLLRRRARGEPVAYLCGEKGFWTLSLKVDASVLVPRPETELLVEWVLQCLPPETPSRVADLGTGSGAIALSIAVERPHAQVLATDLSNDALRVARDNARVLGLERVEFRSGCWLEPLADETYDLIVSNPPYIAMGDPHLAELRHEPLMALTDGADGLNAIREIVATAPSRLVSGGWLLLEHGYDQGAAVREVLAAAGFTSIETRRDLGGHERVSGGRRP